MRVNILNLAAYDVTHIEETEHDYHITADTINSPTACPYCRSDYLVGFGRREQMVWDLPKHAKPVGIYINTKRFRCRACTKIFYEALPDVDEKRAMTKRLIDWLGKQSTKRTFKSLADDCNGLLFFP